MKVNYSYLPRQFAEIDDLLKDIKKFVQTGDFTLGKLDKGVDLLML